MKLSDAEVEKLRRLAGEGRSAGELADRFGISRRHAARLAASQSRPVLASPVLDESPGPVSRALRDFLAGLDKLDPARRVNAATAVALARAIDETLSLGSAAALSSLPRSAATLVEIVAGLAPVEDDLDARVRRLLSPFYPARN